MHEKTYVMEDSSSNWGVGLIGGFIVLLILFSLFSGNSWAGNNSRTCADVSNCDVKVQEIIDTATTQNLINTNANRVIEADNANTARLYDQAARQFDANQAEKLFDCKINAQTTAILNGQALAAKDAEIAMLKQRVYTDAQFAEIRSELCQIPKSPRFNACVTVCDQKDVG